MSKNDDKKFLPINYTNREFSGIRSDLVQMAERFYPDTFQDFSEASFGAMMIDAVAYVGDQLSFYLDYNVNESFLDTSFQYDNVIRHGRILGYRQDGPSTTAGEIAIYVRVPAASAGLGPDLSYIPILKRGSRFESTNGQGYILTENVDFNDPANPIVVAAVNNISGAPTHYAIKAYGSVISGKFGQRTITVGAYERFRRVKLKNRNIIEIISVFDDEGHEYFQVDYLSQDMVFKEIPNKSYQTDNVPSILKPMLVTRKYVVERASNGITLQFGSGDVADTNVVASPQKVAMDVFGKSYVTDVTFDPTRLSKNTSYGISPSNTKLYITYRTSGGAASNTAVGNLNKVLNASLDFADSNLLNSGKIQQIKQSIEVSNEKPITGVVSDPSAGEIKRRIFDTFPTQNRAVTQADYENIAYRMPKKFGSIKRCTVYKDADSLKRNLNMYVISEDSSFKLIKRNNTIKNNLKTWLNNYRMVNDTIDILDPFIINLGIEFIIRLVPGKNKDSVISKCYSRLSSFYSQGFFVAEHLQISDIYSELKKVEGVLDVTNVKIVNNVGGQYSPVSFNVNKNMSPDGSQLLSPANAIFEIKYPNVDIRGKIK